MTQPLTTRQAVVLHRLMLDESQPLAEYARQLQVSKRTLQRDLEAIQAYVRPFGLEVAVSRQGVQCIGPPASRQRVLREISERMPREMVWTPRQRAVYAVLELLLNDGPLKLMYLAKRLHVTAASVSHDLDQVSDWLEAHGLRLVRRRGYGVEISGPEVTRREMAAEIIHQLVSMPLLVSRLGTSPGASEMQPLPTLLQGFGEARIRTARQVVEESLRGIHPPLDEGAKVSFLVHVLLAWQRVDAGCVLPEEATPAHGSMPDVAAEWETCRNILQRLLPNAANLRGEVQYLARHLRGAKVQPADRRTFIPMNMTVMALVRQLVEKLADLVGVPLLQDEALILGLTQHLEPALYRMQTGLSIRNPLLEEVQRRYPQYYEWMRQACEEVMAPYGSTVPEAEVGYLTMHLGAAMERWQARTVIRVKIVCPNGISSAALLASRVQREFPQVKVTGVDAAHALDASSCDLVVSTVPLPDLDVPHVTVSPFLNEPDVVQVREALQALGSVSRTGGDASGWLPSAETDQGAAARHPAQAVGPVHVREVDVNGVPELISRVAADVAACGDASDAASVAAALHAREQLGSVVIPGQHTAVLHGRPQGLVRGHIAVYRLNRPLSLPSVGTSVESVDCVLVLLARLEELPEVVDWFGRISSTLVMDPAFVDVLRRASQDEMERVMRRLAPTDSPEAPSHNEDKHRGV
ncbi:BglG family transcription antiterminator [Alicyclobacillus contaminans]|uniref:BglG family transcription antiterminator n=1 Tax=Alicyclobacillus contaminans TaxID=392016 RepID=UPI000424154E|nr:BglG family transcription antiterminator [Alicyclobacillus contaminans]